MKHTVRVFSNNGCKQGDNVVMVFLDIDPGPRWHPLKKVRSTMATASKNVLQT
jgi:hypothetical protein